MNAQFSAWYWQIQEGDLVPLAVLGGALIVCWALVLYSNREVVDHSPSPLVGGERRAESAVDGEPLARWVSSGQSTGERNPEVGQGRAAHPVPDHSFDSESVLSLLADYDPREFQMMRERQRLHAAATVTRGSDLAVKVIVFPKWGL